MRPFILAKGRNALYNCINNKINNIVRFHTDGFICRSKLNINIGDGLRFL